MNPTHEELREAIGAYVLGQLDDDLRTALEAHLAECAECRADVADLAPLAVSLRHVDPDRIVPADVDLPAALDRRISRALAQESASSSDVRPSAVGRWVPAAVGALVGAAAAAAVVLAVVQPEESPAGPTIIAVPDVRAASGVQAVAGLVDHTWGVEIKLEASGLPAGQAYDVMVVDAAGREYDAGAFLGVSGRKVVCSMNSSVLLADAARFEVVDPGGEVVISGPIGS
jgi:anti-sigma factor RsiW